jgi:hypothetical protein
MIRLQNTIQRLLSSVKDFNITGLLTLMSTFGKAIAQGGLVFYNFFKNIFLAVTLAALLGVLLLNYFSTNFLRALAG